MSARLAPSFPVFNTDEIVLASASRIAATYTSDDIPNPTGRSLQLVVSLTAGAGSVVVTINGITYALLASASLSGTGTTVLRVTPELTAAANTIAKDIVPAKLQVVSVVSTAALTFSVGLSLIG
jgi:hypothetical protein